MHIICVYMCEYMKERERKVKQTDAQTALKELDTFQENEEYIYIYIYINKHIQIV